MKSDRRQTLAEKALKMTRLQIQEKLPYLTGVLAVPGICWTEDGTGTDGMNLYWNPADVCGWYGKSPLLVQRKYLHLLLHGLYLHSFRKRGTAERSWRIACDLMCEYRIDSLDVPGFARPIPASRSKWYRKIREAEVRLQERPVAEWIARQTEEVVEKLEHIFCWDDHGLWLETSLAEISEEKVYKQLSAEELRLRTESVHLWRTVFEQLDLQVEEHRRQKGGSAGNQSQAIVLEKERGYDYRRFLKQFAVSGEEMCLDTDSFDYIPYDYSRKMYEKLAFLEPLEYKEMQKLQEFVIAIDTSGSCSGEVVRQFLEETWEIFCEKDNFFKKMNIHLMQCDCMVQEHVRITCEEEWKEYLEHMEVKGHSDTDFTPVFRKVDELIASGELRNLKGLLYFTDGDGIYPSEKPPYETAFVFLNKELQKGKAPDWALTLTLDRELETKL